MPNRAGPYRLLSPVGRGGLGVVYRAVDERSGRLVALKLLNRPLSDQLAARRLMREFQALRPLAHRNVVRVLDAGVHDEVPYLAMELVEGLSLRAWLDSDEPSCCGAPPSVTEPDPADETTETTATPLDWFEDEPDSLSLPTPARGVAPAGPLPTCERARLNRPQRLARLCDAVAQVADGLAFIHARGLVHRDIKPSNILVAHGGCAKVVDFGLVKGCEGESETTATGAVVGTYRYMSPEQARGDAVDARSDLYALGGVLYELLCGQSPFCHTPPTALLGAILQQTPAPLERLNPEAPSALGHIALRLLEKEPASRIQSASEVAALVRQARAH